jgi:betaine-aldehyde dehydrogenase
MHDRFVDALQKRIETIRLGDAFDEKTQMGPLISEEQRSKVEGYMQMAQEEGATIVCGGKRPSDPAFRDGFYLLPTLITGVNNDMRIAKEEIFGPVITVESFDNEEQAVQWANDTVYGLSAGVWTRDQDRSERVASALRAGTVWINDFNIYFVQAPWGGYKQSGIGRELGKPGLEEYTEMKHIYQNHANEPVHWFGA